MKVSILIKSFFPWLLLLLSVGLITYILINQTKPRFIEQEDRISITTSFYPLYFFTSEIAGETASITQLTPSGVEPHEYEPSARDMARIEDSELLILNGSIEEWAQHVIEQLPVDKPVIVTTNPQLSNDPHTWLNPNIAKQEVSTITEGLIKADPEHTSEYQLRSNQLLQQLDALDKEYQEQLSNCRKQEFVTAHRSFEYLATEYGLTQIAIAGLSPEEEPTPKRLVEITDQIKKNDIRYIFFESVTSPELTQVLAQETGVQTLVLDPLESVSPEDMALGKNYFSIMRDNLQNLRLALECQ